MALSRLQQVSIVEEAIEGTAETFATLFTAANSKYLIIDPSLDLSVNVFERNIKRESLTRLQSLTGTKTGSLRFTMELTGDSTASPYAAPAWGLPLRACGFRQEKLIRVPITSITGGPVPHGTSISQAGSSATGVVVGTTYDGEPYLWVAQENQLGHTATGNINAFNNSGSITAGSATVTPNGAASVQGTVSGTAITVPAGYGWYPVSYPLSKMTVGAITGSPAAGSAIYGATSKAVGILTTTITGGAQTVYYRRVSGNFSSGENVSATPSGSTIFATTSVGSQFQLPSLTMGMSKDSVREAIKSARGTVTFSGRIGEPMLMSFEFQGGLNEVSAGVPAQDAGNITGVTYSAQIPPVMLDADLKHGKTATSYSAMYGPCITSIDIAMANEIAFRECMADAAGIQETILASRTPTITIDPELVTEGTWDYLTQFTSNTGSRASLSVGSAAQNAFTFKVGGINWTGITTGDRNGIATRQLTGALNGGSQTVGASSSDNELVLVYSIV